MSWLAQNWFFILFGLLFVGMHLGHDGHGGHGAARAQPLERTSDEDDGRSKRDSSATRRPTGHQH